MTVDVVDVFSHKQFPFHKYASIAIRHYTMKLTIFVILCLWTTLAATTFDTEELITDTAEVNETKEEEEGFHNSAGIRVEHRKKCNFTYTPVALPVCHPLARKDESGNCMKIAALQIDCPPPKEGVDGNNNEKIHGDDEGDTDNEQN